LRIWRRSVEAWQPDKRAKAQINKPAWICAGMGTQFGKDFAVAIYCVILINRYLF
jgi:hypothetical protein